MNDSSMSGNGIPRWAAPWSHGWARIEANEQRASREIEATHVVARPRRALRHLNWAGLLLAQIIHALG